VLQRLHGGVSLEAAVLELLRGLPSGFWPRPCKRLRDWQERGESPSSHTSAYNQARQTLPLSMVQQSCDRIFERLIAETEGSTPAPRAFFLDGSSLRAAHSSALCRIYPPGSNQHGEGHWPVLRIIVAHDLRTGLAMRPEWGPMYGPAAVSEQGLLERAIHRLPQAATVIGDANFGVFSVAWAAAQSGHPVLLRLTAARAERLAEGPLRDGIDRAVVWKPSRADRKSHLELPQDASLKGRLIVRRMQPDNGGKAFLLALFTALAESWQQVLALYGERWNIETDLRTLKSTLKLDQLTCSTPDMIAKEIDMGIAAYNLVRAVACLASRQTGIPPRGYSFTKVRRILHTFGPALATANAQAAQQIFDQIMRYVQQSKLPRRKRPAYPRHVWKRRDTYSTRKT
jgi:hypothetical protein